MTNYTTILRNDFLYDDSQIYALLYNDSLRNDLLYNDNLKNRFLYNDNLKKGAIVCGQPEKWPIV